MTPKAHKQTCLENIVSKCLENCALFNLCGITIFGVVSFFPIHLITNPEDIMDTVDSEDVMDTMDSVKEGGLLIVHGACVCCEGKRLVKSLPCRFFCNLELGCR